MRTGLLLIAVLFCFAQVSSGKTIAKDSYWIQFKDKKGTPYQISQPEKFLSQRAIERRLKQHIAIDSTDLPVSPVYTENLEKLGFKIFHTSKWLNGVTARTADTALVRQAKKLGFVAEIQLTKPALVTKSAIQKFAEPENQDVDPAVYGNAYLQLEQLNGQYLHNKGFRGKGVQIAVLDAGFWHVDQIAAFDSLRNSGRILGTRDFVDPASNVFEQHTHGMSVLSCMGGNLPGTLRGTAPDASFYLFRTEDAATEYLIEEDNWVAAAEYADSLGVDEINSSLGYNVFDDAGMNHVYADMDGRTTRVTQGANMAFRKGILVFSSAGNEGNKSWERIIAPSDGENVIGVAAVDQNGIRSAFSSVGPAYGGAVKPNVAARGGSTYLVTSLETPGNSSGTSFSSPVLAGMGACLIQANPFATAEDLKYAIEQSASQFNSPDSLIGYGIPDFGKADIYLKTIFANSPDNGKNFRVFPNPFQDKVVIKNLQPEAGDQGKLSVFNLSGECIWQANFNSGQTVIWENFSNLPNGFLILKIELGSRQETLKLIKSGK